MLTVGDAISEIENRLSLTLAEDWDNVGLLVGDRDAAVYKIMTCLTVTDAVCEEAVERCVDLIITHHPLPFRGLKTLTTGSPEGKKLLSLIRAGVSIYSAHTAFDSAHQGINESLSNLLQLRDVAPLRPREQMPNSHGPIEGSGRYGSLDDSYALDAIAQRLCRSLEIKGLHRIGAPDRLIRDVGVACGSAGEFLDDAIAMKCQLFITGEMSFHRCLEAESKGIAVLLTGHYASERFAMETMALEWFKAMNGVEVWASAKEEDPLMWQPSS